MSHDQPSAPGPAPALTPLRALHELVVALCGAGNQAEILRCIADAMIALVPAARAAVALSFDPGTSELGVEYLAHPVTGAERIARVKALFPEGAQHLRLPTNADQRRALLDKPIADGVDLAGVCRQLFAAELCDLTRRLLEADHAVTLTLADRDELLGVVLVPLRAGAAPLDRELLETVVRLGAVALRRARTQEALAAREQELARAQRLARVGHWEWDLPGNHLNWSDNIFELFDWPREETFTFAGIAARVHPDDRARNQAFVERLLGGDDAAELRFRVLGRKGQVIHLQQHAEVIRRTNGAPVVVAGTMQDVSHLERAGERLLEVQSAAKIGGWEYDATSGESYWSPELYRLLRIEPAQAVPTLDEMAPSFHPGDWARLQEAFTRALSQGANYSLELRLRPERGIERWCWARGVAHRDDRGKVIRVTNTLQEITERKQAEAALRTSEAELADADRLATMGTLAAGIAHEINNPLAVLIADLDVLDAELATPDNQLLADTVELHERASEAVEQALRIRDIVHSLSTFSRVSRKEPAPVDVSELCHYAITVAHHELKYRAQVIEAFGETPPVLAIEGRLAQVVLALLLNAAQSIPEGATGEHQVIVRTRGEGVWAIIEVEDNGPGIAPEELPSLFTRPASVPAHDDRTRLRLSLCNDVVREIGGTIQVTSEAGRGSCFTVRLPANAAVAPPAEPPLVDLPAGERGRILIADDEAPIRALLMRILAAEHDPVAVASGREARDLLAVDQDFDVILLDVMMPELSGVGLHRWLVEHHPQLARQVVFVSGGAFTDEPTDYLAGIDNPQIKKPFQRRHLVQVIRRLVRQAKQPRR